MWRWSIWAAPQNRGCVWRADALRPYAADIAARADAGQLILLTGNAPDVFSAAIESDSADTIEGLGILPDGCGTP